MSIVMEDQSIGEVVESWLMLAIEGDVPEFIIWMR